MAGVGYGVLGAEVPANILTAVTGLLVTVVKALLLIHLLFAFIIIMNPVFQGFEEVVGFPHGECKLSFRSYDLRIS